MIGGIVPVAGISSRMGRWKPGIDIGGKPLILRTIDPLMKTADLIVIVGGYRFTDLLRILENAFSCHSKLQAVPGTSTILFEKSCGDKSLLVVKNSRYHTTDMFHSIRLGAKFLPEDTEKFFILPGDYPFLQKETFIRLLNVDADIVIPSFQGKKGHPVLLKGDLLEDLKNFSDGNLRDFTKKFKIELVEVNDPGIIRDTDTPEDLEWQKFQSR